MDWLDWSMWIKCKPACGFEEICYLPTWPFFVWEDSGDWVIMHPEDRSTPSFSQAEFSEQIYLDIFRKMFSSYFTSLRTIEGGSFSSKTHSSHLHARQGYYLLWEADNSRVV